MAPQKRKTPEPKRRPLLAVLLSSTAVWIARAVAGLGRAAGRYPRPVFGTLGFAAIFGAIAANALWYQPQKLVSPFLATRNMSDFAALPGLHQKQAPPKDMTTFKIERAEPDVVVEGETPVAATSAAALPKAPHQPENLALAIAVQQALIQRGLYDGVADGVIGPRTASAILFFQQTAGLAQTGEVSDDLLKALAADGSLARQPSTASLSLDRQPAPVAEEDPVAAAIRTSDIPAAAPKPKSKPAAAAATGASAQPVVKTSAKADQLADLIRSSNAPEPDPALIVKIQQGLARMQYRGVETDGMLGEGTRAAIRKFEKDYGLPQTGEPSDRVLKKLREIGMA